ncbi:MAG: glutaminyl-peptide cyclotransferase [Gammaproteobacteria bacterium]|nr:glutaminyl-peptide cyclotransferase [Gammaproteobacteria bacterium]
MSSSSPRRCPRVGRLLPGRHGPRYESCSRTGQRLARRALPGLLVLLSASLFGLPSAVAAPTLRWEVVATYRHDPQAFTQGLLLHQGMLYESTGLYGRSSLRRVEPRSGAVQRRLSLPRTLFGEGLALVDDRLIQLTWRAQIGFVYELEGFRRIADFRYVGEGWGLTYDGERLIMSDGSASLRFLDPVDFRERSRLPVFDDGRPVERLNELEHAAGPHIASLLAGLGVATPKPLAGKLPSKAPPEASGVFGAASAEVVFANVWQTDRVVLIDARSGQVRAQLDFASLLTASERAGADVLNGLAYDPSSGELWVTGKLWPKMFVVRLRQP